MAFGGPETGKATTLVFVLVDLLLQHIARRLVSLEFCQYEAPVNAKWPHVPL